MGSPTRARRRPGSGPPLGLRGGPGSVLDWAAARAGARHARSPPPAARARSSGHTARGLFARLIEKRLLTTVPYQGFWRACDTFKDLQTLEGLLHRGPAPWELWRRPPPPQAPDDAAANEATPLPILAAE